MKWFESIKWSDECLECRSKNNGRCPSVVCAEATYDANGDKIPLFAYHADGNTLNQYNIRRSNNNV